MANLIPDVTQYLTAAISSSTSSTYRSAWNSYNSFCLSSGVLSYPLNQFILLFYVAFLARRVCYATIKVYLSALQFHSNFHGYDIQISNMHQLFYLLRGVRRLAPGSSRRRPRRSPITLSHLYRLFKYIHTANLHSVDKIMLQSAITLAFFGMLRSAEYTSPTSSSFVVGSTLQASDISFSPDRQFAMINIKQSKTDPFKTGCTIRIASTNSLLCPVTALRNHLHTRNKSTGPLYIFIDGKYLTRQFVANLLSLALPHVPNINTHSFRIGGASAAASAGIPDSVIQILGRWSSDAYKRYLRLADCTIKDVSMRVSSVSQISKFWDTDAGSSYPL